MTKKEMRNFTKKRLQAAFWDLYEQKRIEQVSVREITERAGYNRGTFYLYYKDVYDMLATCEKELWENLCNPLLSIWDQLPQMSEHELMKLITDIYIEHKRYILILFGSHGDPAFIDAMKNNLKKFFAFHLSNSFQYPPRLQEYLLEFYASGVVNVMCKWFLSDQDVSLETLIDLLKDHAFLNTPFTLPEKL